MKTHLTHHLLVALLCVVFTAELHSQPAAFTFQGSLADNGNPATGLYDLRFTIYDAAANGDAVSGPLTSSPTGVTNGLFAVTLDFGANVFDGGERWLEIAATTNGGEIFTTLVPRQSVTATPYALYALDGPGAGATPWQTAGTDLFYHAGRVGIGTSAPQHPLHAETSANQHAVFGHHTATSLTRFGIAGQSDSTGGRGVFGLATSEIGLNTGVWGQTASSSGRGVLGIAAASTGTARGVFGQSNSPEGTGVYGFALASSGVTHGVHGQVNSPDGYAGFFEGGSSFFEGRVGIGTLNPQSLLQVGEADEAEIRLGLNPQLLLGRDVANSTFRMQLTGTSFTGNVLQLGRDDQGHDLALMGDVGIGTASPSEKLHVAGNARIDGDIILPATTRTLMIPAMSFQHEDDFDDLGFFFLGGEGMPILHNLKSLDISTRLAGASVRLPHGAVVTEFSAWVFDTATNHNLDVLMSRQLFGSIADGSEQMASVTSSGSGGSQVSTDTTVSFPTIENDNYMYWVNVRFPNGTPAQDLGLTGIRITYQITSPLP